MAKLALKSKKTADQTPAEEVVTVEAAPDASFMEEKGTKLTKKISIARKEEKKETPEAAKSEKAVEKSEAKEEKKAPTGKTKPRGKKYQEAVAKAEVDAQTTYKVAEAISKAQAGSYSKFPGTLEVHINTNMKNIRGLASLPHATGKKLTILAFGKGAEESGADLVGTEETVEEILKGKLNFDVIVTSPDFMPKLAKAARILGPRGMMPNPKNGTISDNLLKAVTDIQSGKVEYRTEPNGMVIHMGIGKVDQDVTEIVNNIKVLYNTIGKSKVKKMTLAATMGPGVRVDLSSI